MIFIVTKVLKSNTLSLRYEYLNDEGTNLKKSQAFKFLPLNTSDDDYYSLAVEISNVLLAPAKSIEQSTISQLVEG